MRLLWYVAIFKNVVLITTSFFNRLVFIIFEYCFVICLWYSVSLFLIYGLLQSLQSRTSFCVPTQFDELDKSHANSLLRFVHKDGSQKEVSSNLLESAHLAPKSSLSRKKTFSSLSSSLVSSSSSLVLPPSTQEISHATAHTYGRTFMSS